MIISRWKLVNSKYLNFVFLLSFTFRHQPETDSFSNSQVEASNVNLVMLCELARP